MKMMMVTCLLSAAYRVENAKNLAHTANLYWPLKMEQCVGGAVVYRS